VCVCVCVCVCVWCCVRGAECVRVCQQAPMCSWLARAATHWTPLAKRIRCVARARAIVCHARVSQTDAMEPLAAAYKEATKDHEAPQRLNIVKEVLSTEQAYV
jgi:hypothetical protein